MYENLSDEDAALQADQRLSELETAYRKNFVERGFILLAVENRQLWRYIFDDRTGCLFSSFDRWILDRAPHSRSDCYASLAAVKELKDIPEADLAEIPRKNIPTLQKLSTAVRQDPEVLQAAKTDSESDFITRVQKKYPNQHLELKQRIVLKPVQSLYDSITGDLDIAKVYYGVQTWEEALEAILCDWKESQNPHARIAEFEPETVH